MKMTLITPLFVAIAGVLATPIHASDSLIKPINDQIYGTFYGRIQYLGMYRDYDSAGYGHASTLGVMLGYTSSSWSGFDLGVAYNYAETLWEGGNTALLANDDIHLLNEAWLRYGFEAFGLKKTNLLAGRKITHGQIFRTDDYRQKARSIESLQLTSSELGRRKFFSVKVD